MTLLGAEIQKEFLIHFLSYNHRFYLLHGSVEQM